MSENIINNVTLELQYDDAITTESEALNTAERQFYDSLLPRIEAVMDSFSHHNLSIDEIDIDLGKTTPDDAPRQLEDILREEISRYVRRNGVGEKESLVPSRLMEEEKDGESIIAQLMDFIVSETIPWQMDAESFDAVVWWNGNITDIIAQPQQSLALFRECSSDSATLARLLTYSSSATIRDISQAWMANNAIMTDRKEYILSNILLEGNDVEKAVESEDIAQHIVVYGILFASQREEEDIISVLRHTEGKVNVAMNETQQEMMVRLLAEIKSHERPLSFVRKRIKEEIYSQSIAEAARHGGQGERSSLTSLSPILPVSEGAMRSRDNDDAITDLTYRRSPLTSLSSTLPVSEEARMSWKDDEAITDLLYRRSPLPASPEKGRRLENDEAITDLLYRNKEEESAAEVIFPKEKESAVEAAFAYEEKEIAAAMAADYGTKRGKHYATDAAGIVLIHPFLTNYFQLVGLLNDKNEFLDLQHQIHAVHLLRHLTGRKSKHYGYLMNLEKILCGLSPDFPIPMEYEITKEEEEESRNMFGAIKQYWASVGGTSIQGIQESFIQREGIISYEDPYWLIRVEGSAIDILMDDLPWELSTLLLPWTEKDIWVEWQ